MTHWVHTFWNQLEMPFEDQVGFRLLRYAKPGKEKNDTSVYGAFRKSDIAKLK